MLLQRPENGTYLLFDSPILGHNSWQRQQELRGHQKLTPIGSSREPILLCPFCLRYHLWSFLTARVDRYFHCTSGTALFWLERLKNQ